MLQPVLLPFRHGFRRIAHLLAPAAYQSQQASRDATHTGRTPFVERLHNLFANSALFAFFLVALMGQIVVNLMTSTRRRLVFIAIVVILVIAAAFLFVEPPSVAVIDQTR
jgi:uncharacterized membrane protein